MEILRLQAFIAKWHLEILDYLVKKSVLMAKTSLLFTYHEGIKLRPNNYSMHQIEHTSLVYHRLALGLIEANFLWYERYLYLLSFLKNSTILHACFLEQVPCYLLCMRQVDLYSLKA